MQINRPLEGKGELCPKHHTMARIHIHPELQLQRIQDLRQRFEVVAQLPSETLLRQPAPKKWSPGEIVEHMVEAHKLYIPKLDTALNAAAPTERWEALKAGRMASFLFKGFAPKDGKVRYKMKTQQVFEPKQLPQVADAATLDKVFEAFRVSLDHLAQSARSSAEKDVAPHRFNSAIGPVVRFNAAEAVEFILRHNERHFFQLDQTLKALDV